MSLFFYPNNVSYYLFFAEVIVICVVYRELLEEFYLLGVSAQKFGVPQLHIFRFLH